MNRENAEKIRYMILEELRRFGFVEVCELWELTTDEVEEFLNKAVESCGEDE